MTRGVIRFRHGRDRSASSRSGPIPGAGIQHSPTGYGDSGRSDWESHSWVVCSDRLLSDGTHRCQVIKDGTSLQGAELPASRHAGHGLDRYVPTACTCFVPRNAGVDAVICGSMWTGGFSASYDAWDSINSDIIRAVGQVVHEYANAVEDDGEDGNTITSYDASPSFQASCHSGDVSAITTGFSFSPRPSKSPYQLLSSPPWQHHLIWISRSCLQQYQLRTWTPLGLNLGGRRQWGIGADHRCSQSREDRIFLDMQIVWRESICGIAGIIIILALGLQAHWESRLQTGSTDPVVHLVLVAADWVPDRQEDVTLLGWITFAGPGMFDLQTGRGLHLRSERGFQKTSGLLSATGQPGHQLGVGQIIVAKDLRLPDAVEGLLHQSGPWGEIQDSDQR